MQERGPGSGFGPVQAVPASNKIAQFPFDFSRAQSRQFWPRAEAAMSRARARTMSRSDRMPIGR